MKKTLATFSILFSMIISTSVFGVFGMNKYESVSGETFITNQVNKQLNVKWKTALSSRIESGVNTAEVPPNAKKFKAAGGVEWFREDVKGSMNDLIYTIDVRVYNDKDDLVSEKKFEKTLAMDQLFGKEPKDNLYITIGSDYNISIVVQ